MPARLYWFPLSHPAHAVRRMLELKGIEYELSPVLPGTQRMHLRLVGFRGGTVPALKLDGRRVQGSRAIARALEAARPTAALPHRPGGRDLGGRGAADGAAADRSLGPDLGRGAAALDLRGVGRPGPGVVGALGLPAAKYYARAVGADEAAVRRALDEFPGMLTRVDALLADGVLTPEAPDAATLQVLSACARSTPSPTCTTRSPRTRAPRPRELFPDYPTCRGFSS